MTRTVATISTHHFARRRRSRHFAPVRHAARQRDSGTANPAGDPTMIVLDARDWEPPRPFEEVLNALCGLQPGERIRLIIDREPLPLYKVLERNGYAWFTMVRDDGAFEVDICERVAPGDD
jgi:uncharacterized protein (DUF2249 family)